MFVIYVHTSKYCISHSYKTNDRLTVICILEPRLQNCIINKHLQNLFLSQFLQHRENFNLVVVVVVVISLPKKQLQ